MFKIGDYAVYKRNVCKIRNIKDIKDKQYYVLEPIDDTSLLITIPVGVDTFVLRNIIPKLESEKLINLIPQIELIETKGKYIETEYKTLINTGDLKDLVKIIKTTYLRNFNRLNNHKKIGEKDDNYFKKAEKLLYNELSVSLGLSYEETEKYVKNKVESIS